MVQPFRLVSGSSRRLIVGSWLLLITAGIASATAQVTNLQQLELCAAALADTLLVDVPTGSTLCLETVPHPADWIIEQAIIASAADRTITIAKCRESRSRSLTVAVEEVRATYRPLDGDMIERVCRFGIGVTFDNGATESGSLHLRARSVERTMTDTIGVEQIAVLDGHGYAFARGVSIGSASGGFWDKIVEPAIVLGASAVVLILLFTVRSQ